MNSSSLALSSHGIPHSAVSRRARPAPFLPHARISVQTAIWAVLLAIGLVCPFTISASFFTVSSAEQLKLQTLALHPGYVFLVSVLVGPLLEEVVYRGLFLQTGRRYLPLWLAIVIPSAVFTATHIFPAGWAYLPAFPMSCIFCWLLVRTESLYASLLCHSAFNLFSGFVILPAFGVSAKVFDRPPGLPLNPLTELFPFWWTATSLALIVAAFVMIARDTATRRQSAAVPVT